MSGSSPTNLCAVLLCARTRTGAKLVFSTSDADHSLESNSSAEPKHETRDGAGTQDGSKSIAAAPSTPQDTTLGFKTSVLQERLCPARWSDQQKFEMTIDNVTFVSQPCFAVDGESWATERPSTDSTQGATSTSAIDIKEPEPKPIQDFTHAADSFDSGLSAHSLGTSVDSVSTHSAPITEGLQMFHIIFAYRRSHDTTLYSLQAADVYNELCIPFTTALRHLQEHYRYVELQCRKINLAKTRSKAGNNASVDVRSDSELAAALEIVYRSIKEGQIAKVVLQGMELSLQIARDPMPSPLPRTILNLAILLLEDRSSLLRSLDGRPGTAAICYFLTHLTPSKPLSKMATKLALPPEAVLFLVEHLVKWRKARLIDPLHVRNTYVVSPTAELDALPQLAIAYAKKFPALQSLDQMLSMLGSGTPSPYVSCIPSKVHRDTFVDILAWLVRNELVTRMHTVGWLVLRVKTADDVEDDGVDDSSSTISDSGTAFRPDEQRHPHHTETRRVLDPASMTAGERSAVLALRHSLGSDDEIQDTFTRLVKYFDGECPFENIAVLEGMKRSKVEACLSKLHDMSCLQTYQYV